MTEQEQARLERQHLLEEGLQSEFWQKIGLPVLQQRREEMQARVMRAKSMDEVTTCQGAWGVVEMMLSDPFGFFGERLGK